MNEESNRDGQNFQENLKPEKEDTVFQMRARLLCMLWANYMDQGGVEEG